MISYNGFDFAAAPGTATHWFCSACVYADLGSCFSWQVYERFPDEPGKVIRVSLVRHPADYMRALARYAFPKPVPLGQLDWRQPFDRVVCEYLERFPGAISRIMLGYQADTYLKTEDLPHAFLEFAEALGVSREILARPFFHNVTDDLYAGVAPIEQGGKKDYWKDKLVEVEHELCDLFDYF
jgi:hypothetical protein